MLAWAVTLEINTTLLEPHLMASLWLPLVVLPYQSLECTNTIGLLRIGSLANNQGIVRCNTTITSGLDRYVNYFAVYTDSVFNIYSYTAPTVEPNMTQLSLLTPRDTETNIMFTLSFTVSFEPPTEIACSRNGVQFFSQDDSLNVSPVVSREVIRSHYINCSYPDMTRVILTQTTPVHLYSCTVYVYTRTGVGTGPGKTLLARQWNLNSQYHSCEFSLCCYG